MGKGKKKKKSKEELEAERLAREEEERLAREEAARIAEEQRIAREKAHKERQEFLVAERQAELKRLRSEEDDRQPELDDLAGRLQRARDDRLAQEDWAQFSACNDRPNAGKFNYSCLQGIVRTKSNFATSVFPQQTRRSSTRT